MTSTAPGSQSAPWRARQALAAGLAVVLSLGPSAALAASSRRAHERVTLAPTVGASQMPPEVGSSRPLATSAIRQAYETMPLYFVPNRGQMDGEVLFYEQSKGHAARFTRDGVYLSVLSSGPAGKRRHVAKLSLIGGAETPTVVPESPQPAQVSSFIGEDPARWRSDLPTYGALLYRDVYPGIDMRFHGDNRELEYDLIVHPGADPSAVRLGLQGVDSLALAAEGRLSVRLGDAELTQKAPRLYQDIDGRRVAVEGRFKVHRSRPRAGRSREERLVYGFEVGAYDRSRTLVIDPTLQYSSYLGGSSSDSVLGITVRPGGTVFVTGSTQSADFDTKVGSFDTTYNTNTDAFVSKFNVTLSGAASLVFSTYLGGAGTDQGNAVAINAAGEVLVVGTTTGGFPTTGTSFQPAYMGGASDGFLTKLNAAGGGPLVYSTYIGSSGPDDTTGVAVDGSGSVYVTGRSTSGPYGGFDAYVAKLNLLGGGGSDLIWYGYAGGSGNEVATGLAVTSAGVSYVTGSTPSADFTTLNAFDASFNGATDAFVTVLNAAGGMTYSTYLGGAAADTGYAIAVDGSGRAYVAGGTASNPFPTTVGAFDTSANGGLDGFVAKINPSVSGVGSLVYSTYLGGSAADEALGIAYDGVSGVCVTGYTISGDFPTVNPLQVANAGGRDIFVSHVNTLGSALTFSTYQGGTGNDTGNGVSMVGNLCCAAGVTSSTNYPTTLNAFQTMNDGVTDGCLTCMSAITTAVELMGFDARPFDSAVELRWQTGSELFNLGFHLYRSESAEGPYERITSSVIPGLGSSPEGASYSYVDRGLANGVTYFYELEDIETTGATKRHGPVSAQPSPSGGTAPGGGEDEDPEAPGEGAPRIAYGNPSPVSLRILERSEQHALLELRTGGFYAVRQPDGTVRLEIPGMERLLQPGLPGIPVKRALVEATVGRRARVAAIRSEDVLGVPGLVPALSGSPEMVASEDGVVRARVGRATHARTLKRGLFPVSAARLVSTAFQGETKKALVELWPLRWDSSSGRLELTRRLVVRLEFSGVAAGESSRGRAGLGRRYPGKLAAGGDTLLAQLVVRQRGLHAVGFEELFGARRRGIPLSELRLGRQGQSVPFHVEPSSRPSFALGSVLYFFTEGSSLNPYGNEAVYELSRNAGGGSMMPVVSAAPSGSGVAAAFGVDRWEENKTFQPGLLDAPDIWLWDSLIAPATRSYGFTLENLGRAASEPSQLEVFLQGGSDEAEVDDHHVRVSVNGTAVGDVIWDGKAPVTFPATIEPGILREGANVLALESLGDAGASYSLAFLDHFELAHPRSLSAPGGVFEAGFPASGSAKVWGLGRGALLLDTTSPAAPRWLYGAVATPGGLVFGVEAGRKRLALSPSSVLHPEVRLPVLSSLRAGDNRADYLLLAPQAFLSAAQPLLELRAEQGLAVKAAALEEVYQEFGHGEATPQAIHDFLAYAYHFWQAPSPRYVLLLGDASYDYKDFLHTGAPNPLPPLLVKTSFLWTASDSAYAAVNGEDALPDLAIGRLPASTVDQARALVEKVVAFESSGLTSAEGAAVLVADNADGGGDFEASAQAVVPLLAPDHAVETIFLREQGAATRSAIASAFDRGAALVSYLGHGGIAVWASENVFNNQDVANLAPQSRQPLLLTMDCLNGYFHFPVLDSLAEAFLKAPDRGSIASFSPSGLSLHEPADLFHQALVREISSGAHERLGDAVFAAQIDYAESGAMPELLSIYNLLGDPALKIR